MPAPSADMARIRASVARRTQSYPDDHPKVVEARQDLDYAMLAQHAARVVAAWPAPTEEQLAKVAAILRRGMA
jgi:hypothetical protein